MRTSATAAPMIFVVVAAFINVKRREVLDGPASVDAAYSVAAIPLIPTDARVPFVMRRDVKAIADTVMPRREKNFRSLSMAVANSRLATVSEQPTNAAAARWLLFWK